MKTFKCTLLNSLLIASMALLPVAVFGGAHGVHKQDIAKPGMEHSQGVIHDHMDKLDMDKDSKTDKDSEKDMDGKESEVTIARGGVGIGIYGGRGYYRGRGYYGGRGYYRPYYYRPYSGPYYRSYYYW